MGDNTLEIIEYINSAETQEERTRRKAQAFPFLYGGCRSGHGTLGELICIGAGKGVGRSAND